jgi:hypothetical protein
MVNCDQTMWRVVASGLFTSAPIGDDGVAVHVKAAEKEAITALANITAAHDKLPLFLIAKYWSISGFVHLYSQVGTFRSIDICPTINIFIVFCRSARLCISI